MVRFQADILIICIIVDIDDDRRPVSMGVCDNLGQSRELFWIERAVEARLKSLPSNRNPEDIHAFMREIFDFIVVRIAIVPAIPAGQMRWRKFRA